MRFRGGVGLGGGWGAPQNLKTVFENSVLGIQAFKLKNKKLIDSLLSLASCFTN